MKLTAEISIGWDGSCKYLNKSLALLKESEHSSLKTCKNYKFSKEQDLAFLNVGSDEHYNQRLSILENTFKAHNISYQLRQKSAPFGIHIKGVSIQTQALYSLYKKLDFSHMQSILEAGIIAQTPGMKAKEDHVALYSAISLPTSRLQKHFSEKSVLLFHDIISWIKDNASRLNARLYMMNSAFLYILSTNPKSKLAESHRTESYAWHLFAIARAQADAMKCKDKSCMGSAQSVPFEIHQMLGDEAYQDWDKQRMSNTKYLQEAVSLFEQNPPANHQPFSMANSGMRSISNIMGIPLSSEPESSEDSLFKPEKECLEIEKKVLSSLKTRAAKVSGAGATN